MPRLSPTQRAYRRKYESMSPTTELYWETAELQSASTETTKLSNTLIARIVVCNILMSPPLVSMFRHNSRPHGPRPPRTRSVA